MVELLGHKISDFGTHIRNTIIDLYEDNPPFNQPKYQKLGEHGDRIAVDFLYGIIKDNEKADVKIEDYISQGQEKYARRLRRVVLFHRYGVPLTWPIRALGRVTGVEKLATNFAEDFQKQSEKLKIKLFNIQPEEPHQKWHERKDVLEAYNQPINPI